MRQVFAKTIIVLSAVVFFNSEGRAQNSLTDQLLAQSMQTSSCQSAVDAHKKYTDALDLAKLDSSSNSDDAIRKAKSCAQKDEEFDPEDDEFSCDDIDDNCPMLSAASAETLKSLKDEAAKEKKELQTDVDDKIEDQNDLKKEIAELSKEYAERENDLNKDILDVEKEYKAGLSEKDKEALQQVQDIQQTISKIADENRKIILQANRAMAELAAAKLNAKKTCRDTARADYQATLKQLDEELAKRGGKIAGGFEGIQNAEKYRKFLIAKIKNPEPSEQFTLCYSVGDAIETDLQQRNMGGALTMNEFVSQIEENNKQRDQLQQQLQQQQQLAQNQKIEGYQEHTKNIQAIQKKISTNRQNFERESRALIEKQQSMESRLTKMQKELGEAIRRASNSEDRYNCLTRKNITFKDSTYTSGKQLYTAIGNTHYSLTNMCGGSTCSICKGFGGISADAPTSAPAAGSGNSQRVGQ